MKPREILGLVKLRSPARRGSLAACHDLADVHRLARRRLPTPVAEYVDGGAGEEITLAAAEKAFRTWSFQPRSLVDVSRTTTDTVLFEEPFAAPLGLAPTGYTRMINPDGETAVASAAHAAGLPYVLSTMASTSLKDLRRSHPDARLWFQLYVWRDRDIAERLIATAAEAGYGVLEVAIDTAVPAVRLRDLRSGLTIPPSLSVTTLLRIATRPRYWLKMLRSPALTFANTGRAGTTPDEIGSLFDPTLDWADLAWIRSIWPGKLLIKGPISASDAVRAVDMGVDGIHLSAHGGRQLDRVVAPVHQIAPLRAAVGTRTSIVVDTGVRSGADVATAIALGADAAFIGRPYLWGLAAHGQDGVSHVLHMFINQFRQTLQLLGIRSVAELRDAGPELLVRSAELGGEHSPRKQE